MSEFERTLDSDPRLFIRGKCSSCGCMAQRRVHGEDWWHVSAYNDYGILSARACSKPGVHAPRFVPQETAVASPTKFQMHYRSVQIDTIDEDGNPTTYDQPVVCSCTNSKCPGWGVEVPQWVWDLDKRKVGHQTDPRDDLPCPKCGEICRYDGWDHVHRSGLGIGSCQ